MADPTPTDQRVPWEDKAAAGLGGITETLTTHALRTVAGPLLNLGLGLNPVLVGAALAIPRVASAAIDPTIGYMSDRLRGGLGCRRPLMLIGAPLAGVAFAALWWLDPAPRTFSAGFFWRFVGVSAVFFAASSLFVIPWEALLVELSDDPQERTRVQAYRSIAATFGSLCLPWFFAASQAGPWAGTGRGTHVVGLGVGSLIVLTGIAAGLGVRERAPKPRPRAPDRLVDGFRAALRNRTFLAIVLMMLLYGPGLMVTDGLALYVNIYYVFHGRIAEGAIWQAVTGSLLYGLKFVSIPVVTAWSGRIGKRRALFACLAVSFISEILKWVCYQPDAPAWQLLVPAVQGLGMGPAWMLMASMLADATDEGEAREGRRRAGLLMAIAQWVQRSGQTGAIVLSGIALAAAGFSAAAGAFQNPSVVFHLRLLMCVVPAIATLLAGLVLALTQDRRRA